MSQLPASAPDILPPAAKDNSRLSESLGSADELGARVKVNGHYFTEVSFSSGTYCSHCRQFIWGIRRQGYSCDVCRYPVHEKCLHAVAEKCYIPKMMPNSNPISFEHHWRYGNVASGKCSVCENAMNSQNGGFDMCSCVRCDLKLHQACAKIFNHNDFKDRHHCRPTFASMIVCDEALSEDFKVPDGYRPLVVYVNGKSGGQQGHAIMRKLRGILSGPQIIDLFGQKPVGPNATIEKYKALPNQRILACGGDGTAAWIMSAMLDHRDDFINASYIPPIGVLPLGTGNDLARVLGWGGGYDDSESLSLILKAVLNQSGIVTVDRWLLEITPHDQTKEPFKHVFNNYFSIGLDAEIAMQFHTKREASPGFFKSRVLNKGVYGLLGMSKIVDTPPIVSQFALKVYADGELVNNTLIDHLSCLVWQNIPSYMGGTVLWHHDAAKDNLAPCLKDDMLLELVGLRDIAHVLALTAVGSHGLKLRQARKYRIEVGAPCSVQVDGEPRLIGPSVIEITHFNQANMLAKLSGHHSH